MIRRNKIIGTCALIVVALACLLYVTMPTVIARRFAMHHPDFRIKPITASSALSGRRNLYQFEIVDGQESWVADFSATLRGVIFEECSFWMRDVQGHFK